MEQKTFHFCPFCGETLNISATCRFCPYCGKRLKEKVPKTRKRTKEDTGVADKAEAPVMQTSPATDIVEVLDTLAISAKTAKVVEASANVESVDKVVAAPLVAEKTAKAAKAAETPVAPVAPAKVAKAVATPIVVEKTAKAAEAPAVTNDMLARAKGNIQEPSKRAELAAAVQPVADECTLVLKYCPDKEKLLRKLELLLRRDRFAIRLAVDMAPAVLMYKNKLEDVLPVADACREVGALTAVVIGPFSLQSDFPPAALAYLSEEEHAMVKKAPAALWAGEQISHFAGAVDNSGEQGILALSEQNLIFFAFPQNDFILRMIALETLDTAQLVERPEGMRLVIRQKRKNTEEVYEPIHTKAFLALDKALQAILQRANYLK